ncbi:MAG: hypothetical protein ACFFDN_11300 [Candidatus Hodarchaeota archaeon]
MMDLQNSSKKFSKLTIHIKNAPFLTWNNNGIPICTYSGDQYPGQMCGDGAGGAIIVWNDNRGTQNDIYIQRINSSGDIQWKVNGTPISTEIKNQYLPSLCSDGSSGAIITWQDNRDDTYDIYAQRIDANGTIMWKANGTVICNSSGGQAMPQICSDGEGGGIITWHDNRGVNNDIYAQRIDANGNTLWTPNGTPICTASNYQQMPYICSDGNAGAIIGWTDARNFPTDIYAQRINASGQVQWVDNGVPICSEIGSQWNPIICSDGDDGTFFTWQDEREGNGKGNIFAQKVKSNGEMEWTTNGIAICTLSNDQTWPKICNDGAGGLFITWQDERNGFEDIYAQRVNKDGTIQWINGGIAICTENDSQIYPKICRYGEGAVIVWTDSRATGEDIYAQYIDLNGNIKWNNNGTAICTEVGSQFYPYISSDDNDGLVILWRDYRSGSNWDLFVQHITKLPTSNHPDDIATTSYGTESIDWRLYTTVVEGKYRILVNDTNNIFYIWEDWTPWTNGSSLSVPINRSINGVFKYVIEYNDTTDQYGINDNVIVYVDDNGPSIFMNYPQNETVIQKPDTILLTISDPNLIISTVEWRANITQINWSKTFYGSFDILLTNFSSNQIVEFFIRANDSLNNSNQIKIILTFDNTPPTKPTNPLYEIHPYKIFFSKITLYWDSSIDDNIIYYEIWRNGKNLGIITSNNFSDSEHLDSGKYIYKIIPIDEAGNYGQPLYIKVNIISLSYLLIPFLLISLENDIPTIMIIIIIAAIALSSIIISILKKRRVDGIESNRNILKMTSEQKRLEKSFESKKIPKKQSTEVIEKKVQYCQNCGLNLNQYQNAKNCPYCGEKIVY